MGDVKLHPSAIADRGVDLKYAPSPGMRHKHYSPEAQLILVEGELNAMINKIHELIGLYREKGRRVGILATDETQHRYHGAYVVKSIGSREDPSSMARNLFKLLREFDEEKVDVIIAEGVPMKSLGLAVMNRLRKASGFNIVKAN